MSVVGVNKHVTIEAEPVPFHGNNEVKKLAKTENRWEEEAPLKYWSVVSVCRWIESRTLSSSYAIANRADCGLKFSLSELKCNGYRGSKRFLSR
jgi:hypothetical protein